MAKERCGWTKITVEWTDPDGLYRTLLEQEQKSYVTACIGLMMSSVLESVGGTGLALEIAARAVAGLDEAFVDGGVQSLGQPPSFARSFRQAAEAFVEAMEGRRSGVPDGCPRN